MRPGPCRSLVSKHHPLTNSWQTKHETKIHEACASQCLRNSLDNQQEESECRHWNVNTCTKPVSSCSACPLGPAYDLTFTEVRDDSVVVEWQKPVYPGSGPITGYHVEYAKKGTSEWTTANQTAVSHRFHKVRTWFMVLVWSLIWIPSIYYLDTVQFDIKNTNELISTLTDLFIY